MSNFKEVPNGVPQADQQKYAPELSRLHPTLEGKVRIEFITRGGKSKKKLLRDLARKHVNIGSDPRLVDSTGFTTSKEHQETILIIGNVGDLVPNPERSFATTKEIWLAGNEKGLDPVPADTAPYILLQKGDQLQRGDLIWMWMKTIADRYGFPHVFGVERTFDGLWLTSTWIGHDANIWSPSEQFAFSLPQVTKA